MTTISTHVLDTARGTPAEGVVVHLALRLDDGSWRPLASAATDPDGRVSRFHAETSEGNVFRLTFEVEGYLREQGAPVFFPWVQVCFVVSGAEGHLHVPLLFSPFGYSTYRGS